MKKYKFQGKVEAGDGGGAHVLFPFDVQKEFGTKGKVPIKATFNGVPYSGSLIKYGNPLHMLPMLKAIREQIGAAIGDTIQIELWKDEAERTLDVPPELQKAMKTAGVLTAYEKLSYTHRREYCRWISEAKKEETRQRRIEKAVEMLRDGIKTPDAPKQRA